MVAADDSEIVVVLVNCRSTLSTEAPKCRVLGIDR
jgi:hypothetical protein